VPEPVVQRQPGATVGIISLGGCDAAIREAVDLLAQQGVRADYLRVRGFPFPEEVDRFCAGFDQVFVVEQNRDGQLRTLLINETTVPKEKLRPVLIYGGFPLSARSVVEAIGAELKLAEPARPAKEATS
jgi:2-oxoglutarate ferredoxin oxidoreductase subunit alpha